MIAVLLKSEVTTDLSLMGWKYADERSLAVKFCSLWQTELKEKES